MKQGNGKVIFCLGWIDRYMLTKALFSVMAAGSRELPLNQVFHSKPSFSMQTGLRLSGGPKNWFGSIVSLSHVTKMDYF